MRFKCINSKRLERFSLSHQEKTCFTHIICKNKYADRLSCAVTVQLISAFDFTPLILIHLHRKFMELVCGPKVPLHIHLIQNTLQEPKLLMKNNWTYRNLFYCTT